MNAPKTLLLTLSFVLSGCSLGINGGVVPGSLPEPSAFQLGLTAGVGLADEDGAPHFESEIRVGPQHFSLLPMVRTYFHRPSPLWDGELFVSPGVGLSMGFLGEEDFFGVAAKLAIGRAWRTPGGIFGLSTSSRMVGLEVTPAFNFLDMNLFPLTVMVTLVAFDGFL